jgi:hypothetical protein
MTEDRETNRIGTADARSTEKRVCTLLWRAVVCFRVLWLCGSWHRRCGDRALKGSTGKNWRLTDCHGDWQGEFQHRLLVSPDIRQGRRQIERSPEAVVKAEVNADIKKNLLNSNGGRNREEIAGPAGKINGGAGATDFFYFFLMGERCFPVILGPFVFPFEDGDEFQSLGWCTHDWCGSDLQ